MKFEDLSYVYNALRFNNPEKRAFIGRLRNMSYRRARGVLVKNLYFPYHEDPILAEAKRLGISRALVLEAARWVIREEEWKRFDIRRL